MCRRKTDAKSYARVRSFNQSGKIGDNKRAATIFLGRFSHRSVGGNDAGPGSSVVKRVVCDFRMRGRNAEISVDFPRSESRPTPHPPATSTQSAGGAPGRARPLRILRRLMPRLGEVLITSPAAPRLAQPKRAVPAWSNRRAVRRILIGNYGANWHQQDHVLAGMPRAIRPSPLPSTIGLEFAVEAVAKQSVSWGFAFKVNAPPWAAIPPGGPPRGTNFSAAKRDAAVPSVAGLYVNFGFINKHMDSISAIQDAGSTFGVNVPAWPGRGAAQMRIRHCGADLHPRLSIKTKSAPTPPDAFEFNIRLIR